MELMGLRRIIVLMGLMGQMGFMRVMYTSDVTLIVRPIYGYKICPRYLENVDFVMTIIMK